MPETLEEGLVSIKKKLEFEVLEEFAYGRQFKALGYQKSADLIAADGSSPTLPKLILDLTTMRKKALGYRFDSQAEGIKEAIDSVIDLAGKHDVQLSLLGA